MKSKNYAKLGNRPGNPTYRTQAMFRYKQYLKVRKTKVTKNSKINPLKID